MHMTPRKPRSLGRAAARGFSLVEIMVAVVVICVGLLGIAKMQALALSSSNIARQRSMAAFLAASLASSMHSNRDYWASAQAAVDSANAPGITINSALGTIAPADLSGVSSSACIGGNSNVAPCPGTAGAITLAGFDLTRWSATVAGLLPNAQTFISCPGAVQPPSCTIQMTWTEQVVMANGSAQVNTGGQFETPTYTLFVEP